MTKNPERVLRLVAGCDVTKLPLGAREGFLLSRIDGPTTIAELVAVTGFAAPDVSSIVDHLERLGVLASSVSAPAMQAVKPSRPAMPATPTAPPVRTSSDPRFAVTRSTVPFGGSTPPVRAGGTEVPFGGSAPPARVGSDPRAPAQPRTYSVTNVPAVREIQVRQQSERAPTPQGLPPVRSSPSPDRTTGSNAPIRSQTPTNWSGTRTAIDPALARQQAVSELDAKERRQLEEELLAKARTAEELQAWADAAIAWLRLRELRPDDGAVIERAANSLRRAGTDLHRAVRLAEEAVQKGPKRPQSRVTLALAYVDAKLFRRAQSELEEAARLSPDDQRVRKLLDQVRKLSA
jgi:hypothetical protein